ncbi:MAG: hypothetical protein AB7Q17_18715 [Phycisphaerae bacterium]
MSDLIQRVASLAARERSAVAVRYVEAIATDAGAVDADEILRLSQQLGRSLDELAEDAERVEQLRRLHASAWTAEQVRTVLEAAISRCHALEREVRAAQIALETARVEYQQAEVERQHSQSLLTDTKRARNDHRLYLTRLWEALRVDPSAAANVRNPVLRDIETHN